MNVFIRLFPFVAKVLMLSKESIIIVDWLNYIRLVLNDEDEDEDDDNGTEANRRPWQFFRHPYIGNKWKALA